VISIIRFLLGMCDVRGRYNMTGRKHYFVVFICTACHLCDISHVDRYGVRADYVRADLTKLADIDALWSEVIRLYPDGVDILVNNAGRVP
jgi:NAD(P)-dependent dehydrogenase (short-subunit alcohol dehydrogenase family)